MKTISAAKFKEQCLSIIDRVGAEGLVITKHGVPVAKIVPVDVEYAQLIGKLSKKIVVSGDLLSTGLDWNAES